MYAYGVSSLIGTAIALPILSICAVILRFHVRLRVRHSYIGADDYIIIVAVLFTCGQCVLQILNAVYGTDGRDHEVNDMARMLYSQKINHAVLVVEKVTYTSIKLSVLYLYRRIFSANRTFRIANDILIVLVVLWGLLFLFLEIFLCTNNAGFTAQSLQSTCNAQEWALLWFAITEVSGDIAILSLPYPCIRKLQMSKRDKIGLAVIFGLGALSTIIGIIRLGYVAKSFYAVFHPQYNNTTGSAPTFWTTMEVCIGVFAACLPPLGPLIRKAPGPKKVYNTIRYGVSNKSRNTEGREGTHKMERLSSEDQKQGPILYSLDKSSTGRSDSV